MLFRSPFVPDAPAESAHIPMIIGNTHDETRSLIGGSDPYTFDLTWDEIPALLARHMRVDITPELVVAEYRRLYPAYSPSDVFFSATTAGWKTAQNSRMADTSLSLSISRNSGTSNGSSIGTPQASGTGPETRSGKAAGRPRDWGHHRMVNSRTATQPGKQNPGKNGSEPSLPGVESRSAARHNQRPPDCQTPTTGESSRKDSASRGDQSHQRFENWKLRRAFL